VGDPLHCPVILLKNIYQKLNVGKRRETVEKAMQYSADFALGRYNFGNLYIALTSLKKR
jgi:hypothetical protein